MNKEYKKELNELGWRYSNKLSMNDYYVFIRGKYEKLAIDVDKFKMIYDDTEEDTLGAITYETLKVVIKIFREQEKKIYKGSEE